MELSILPIIHGPFGSSDRNMAQTVKQARTAMTAIQRTYLFLAVVASLWPCATAVAQPDAFPQQLKIENQLKGSVRSITPGPELLSMPIGQASSATDQALLSSVDRDRLHNLLSKAQAESWAQQAYPQLIQSIAEQFLGEQYRAGLLDQGSKETLVLSLQEFDCVLFIETVLALGKAIIQVESFASEPSIAVQQTIASTTFSESVEDYRYRGGKLQDYCGRLHYFSDWILDNQQRGNVSPIANLKIQPLDKALTFMGNHRGSYPQLKADSQYNCIRNVEQRLNRSISDSLNRELAFNPPFGYIPTAQIRSQYAQLQAGDIVAIATSIGGLDVTHTGLVYRHSNGNLGLIHAAPNAGVILASDLQTYIERVDSAIGIIVTRPNL